MFIVELAIAIGVVLANNGIRNGEREATIGVRDRGRFTVILEEVAVEIKPDISIHQRGAGAGAAGDQVAGLDQFADEFGLN